MTPCLANSPSLDRRPGSARRCRARRRPNRCRRRARRAACSTGVPIAKRPRLPDGVKTTSAVRQPRRRRPSRRPRAPRRSLRSPAAAARGSLADPARAVGIVAHQHVGAHDAGHLLDVQRVGDGRGHAGADRHGQEGRVEAVPVGQAEADIGGAAGGVDLQLLAQAADQAGTPRARHCSSAPIGITSGSTTMSERGMP